MNSSFVLGDIFLYNDKEFIFLAGTADLIYASRVLDIKTTQIIEKKFNEAVVKNKEIALKHSLYCYVILTTAELKDRMATLARPDMNIESIAKKLDLRLNEKDRKTIVDEIMNSRGVPLGLKKLVSSLSEV